MTTVPWTTTYGTKYYRPMFYPQWQHVSAHRKYAPCRNPPLELILISNVRSPWKYQNWVLCVINFTEIFSYNIYFLIFCGKNFIRTILWIFFVSKHDVSILFKLVVYFHMFQFGGKLLKNSSFHVNHISGKYFTKFCKKSWYKRFLKLIYLELLISPLIIPFPALIIQLYISPKNYCTTEHYLDRSLLQYISCS